MNHIVLFFNRIWNVCRLVPLLPVTILAGIPIALLWNARPWTRPFWVVDPSIGQWVVIALVIYAVLDTLHGMIDDIRHGHVGVDILAVVAILSTVAVREYWASWVIVLMIYSGEAIEEYAHTKAEGNLTALMKAAPVAAHVVVHASADGRPAPARNISPARLDLDGQPIKPVAPDSGVCALIGQSAEECDGIVERAVDRYRVDGKGMNFDTVPVGKVRMGDVLVVLPGETVPVDGELLSATATLDLSNINGEPVPREVYAGARVMSGAINGSATLTMRATELARDSQYQRILELVSSARNSRATVVRTADLLAVPFTVISFIIACSAWIVSGDSSRFAQVLVIATPCPLLIAAPVAYIAGTGRLAKAGILIKAQEVLENLGRVSHVFFDKTGTLTVKKPQVVRLDIMDGEPLSHDGILMLAGVLETYSVHILAQGIAKAGSAAIARLKRLNGQAGQAGRDGQAGQAVRAGGAGQAGGTGRAGGAAHDVVVEGLGNISQPVVRNVEEEPGSGVTGEINGHRVQVGRFAYVTEGTDVSPDTAASSIFPTPLAADEMATFVAVDGRLVARIVLKDVPRDNTTAALAKLRALGVRHLSMLTGDKRPSAEIIAREVGIDDVRAELFPEDKLAAVKNATIETPPDQPWWDRIVQKLTGESITRSITMMVGDGVNDAPVLASADIGMAITDGTSTAASESAQVVIMNDDISGVPRAIAIARRTKRVMLQAVLTGLTLSIIAMVMAAFNLIPVVIGALLQEAIDVVSILWALTALLDRE